MPLTIKHAFVSSKPDGNDASLIRPSNWNADHQITGTITEADIVTADNTTGNVSTTKHGWAPKAPGNTTTFLNGNGAYSSVTEAGLTLADNTTGNVNTSRHGFVPKLPDDGTVYLDGEGNFTTPAGGNPWFNNEGDLSYTDGEVAVNDFHIGGKLTNSVEVISTGNTPEFDLELGSNFQYTFNHQNISPTFINLIEGQRVTITFIQSSQYGDPRITWPSNVKNAPQVNLGSNKVTVMEFVSDGTNLYAVGNGRRRVHEVFSDFSISNGLQVSADNDTLIIDRGWANAGGNITYMNDTYFHLTVWNINSASATNPIVLSLNGATGIQNGQKIAISGATGSMASVLNDIHTVTNVTGNDVTISADGTGLVYSGGGQVGIGGSDTNVEVFIVGNANTGNYVFQVPDLESGLVFTSTMTGEVAVGRDLSLNGNGVVIARVHANAVTATFDSIDHFAHTAQWIPKINGSNTIDVTYADDDVTFSVKSLPPMSTDSATVDDAETFVLGADDPTNDMYKLLVTGNCTIDAHVSIPVGKRFIVCIQQDGTGSHTVTFDSKFIGAMTVSSGINTLSIQEFVKWDDNNIAAISPGSVNMAIQGLPS